MNPVLIQFRTEIRHFFLVSILNLVFAAIAISIGVQYLVTAILGQTLDPLVPGFPMIPGLRIFTGAMAMICFGLGIRWILSTVRIFEGIVTIKDDLENGQCNNERAPHLPYRADARPLPG